MTDLGSYRSLAAPAAMAAATSFRMGLAWMEVWAIRSPDLVKLGVAAWKPEEDPDRAAKAYKERFMETYKESASAALKQVQRGISDTESYLDKKAFQPPSGSVGVLRKGAETPP